MILITGASGQVGGTVLQELLRMGKPLRGMYRSEQEAATAPQGANPVVADFADRASLDRALEGVDGVYLVCSPVPQLVELESNVIDACRERGIRHLVLNSAMGAGEYDKSFPRWHYEVERHLQQSGVPGTILRPESFMQNVVNFFSGTIKTQHAFYAAVGDAPIAFIDVGDIGAVAAKVLTSEGHSGKIYTLTGGESLTYSQVAKKLSKLLGVTVNYVNLSMELLKQSMRDLGMPQWQVDALADLQAFYASGPGTRVTHDVQQILGREPIGFDQFLADHSAAFVGNDRPEEPK